MSDFSAASDCWIKRAMSVRGLLAAYCIIVWKFIREGFGLSKSGLYHHASCVLQYDVVYNRKARRPLPGPRDLCQMLGGNTLGKTSYGMCGRPSGVYEEKTEDNFICAFSSQWTDTDFHHILVSTYSTFQGLAMSLPPIHTNSQLIEIISLLLQLLVHARLPDRQATHADCPVQS